MKVLTIKERMALKRQEMPVQPPEKRSKNWDEVNLGFDENTAQEEASRCISCKKPACVEGCPVGVNIPKFIKEIELGEFLNAYETVAAANRLPAVCGRVCPQEKLCEGKCFLSGKGQAVAIGHLERFVADYYREHGIPQYKKKDKPTGKKIAVIGAGPAGLTAAGDLKSLNHDVTIMEALHTTGGVLAYGIPDFRLPKGIVEHEINILKKAGIQIKTNFIVGKLQTIDELLAEYDAVFIGTGAGQPSFLNIPGETLNGVYSANEYLTRVILMKARIFPEYKTPVYAGENVVVAGCGDTALDACRSAKRLGAAKVSIIYRRSAEEAPARQEERGHAEEEGIEFNYLVNPVKLIDNGHGWVKGVECVRMQLAEPDASGRRRPEPVKNSEFTIPADCVIMAVGAGVNPTVMEAAGNLETGKYGVIIVDQNTGATSRKGVYAAGDIISGGSTVIMAMGQARTAARAIHEYVMQQ